MGEFNSQISKYSDEELMNLVVERNNKALKVLYDRYARGVFNFTLRYTNSREISEDVLQETFVRAWFASHTFNPLKGTFKSWIFTIGINLTRNEMSKKRYEYNHLDLEEITGDESDSNAIEDDLADNLLERTEMKDSIGKALARLNPFLKEVVILKHFHGLKFTEISEITNTPVGTLKARFHHAIGQLKKLLEKSEF
jgi:RNA polymerase sigma-70 factor (ECF subfamily)